MADRDLSGRTLGEFTLGELIGEGGYGALYRARQPALQREVVVKVLREERDSHDARERFMREARLAAQLRHPYAAQVYAFGTEDDGSLLWIAMELVDGITLADWLATHGTMSLRELVPFFDHLAEVVDAMHQCGIVHRDLKPSNVMVVESKQGVLVPKLLDFGIAKAPLTEDHEPVVPVGDKVATALIRAKPAPRHREPTKTRPRPVNVRQRGLTPTGAGFGSRLYMSPEQWGNASDVGPAADIYSLGIMLYEALTGRVPFPSTNTNELIRQHRYEPMPPLGSGFSPELDRVLSRALAKSPRNRHANALELAAELRAVLHADPHEQIRSLAQRWQERGRSPDLLARGQVLADLERIAHRPRAATSLGDLECAFLKDSQRRIRRIRWAKRALAVTTVMVVIGGFLYRASVQTELAQKQAELAQEQTELAQEQADSARKVTEATVTQSELEQGRAALLYNAPDAAIHLGRAYQRGDRTPSTEFMLARALQPRLAEQARFSATAGRMWSAAFSPDGRQIVTTDDRAAQVWDAQTYRRRFVLFHGDTVYQALYSADGAWIVTAGGDGTVKIWDAATGAIARELTHVGQHRRYYVAAMSPDGQFVAAIDHMGEAAHVWDASSGAALAELRNEASGFPSLAFSADGRWLATSGGDDVRVFDARRWTKALTLAGQRVRGLSWDPTGPRLLTGTVGGDASIWAIPSGARIRHLREIGEPVDAMAFSRDGSLVVVASRDGAEQVWDTRSGTLRSQGNYLRGKILSIEFDPTSKLVVSAGASGSVAVADAVLGMPITVLDGPTNVVMAAHFDPQSRRIIGASWDGTARVWDATSPYRRWRSSPIADDCGIVVGLEPDRRFVAVGCRDHPTRVWDTARDELLAELPAITPIDGGFASAFPAVSTAGDRAAIARGNTVEVYELPGGKLLRTVAHGAAVNAVAFASTGHDIVSGAVDGSLLVTRDGRDPLALPRSSGGIDAAGFLPDGRVITTDERQRLRVYALSGTVLADLVLPTRVMSLRMSPDGRRLVTIPSYLDKTAPAILWDLERYRVITQLEGHTGEVFSARWVAGDRIITAGGDGTVRLWDGSTGRLRQTYRGSTRFLADAMLDGSMVVAGGGDGLLRFWDADSERPLWTLPAHKSHVIGIHVEGDDLVTRGFSGEVSRWTLPNPEQVIKACDDHAPCAIVSK